MKDTLRAFSVFICTIIGVGVFALPWTAQKAGFLLLFLSFIVLGSITFFDHWILARVVLDTPGYHRFPGYVKEYLGPLWGKFAFLNMLFGLIGSQLAYLVIGGNFLKKIFDPIFLQPEIFWSFLFFLFGSYFIFRGIKAISLLEWYIFVFFIVLLGFAFVQAYPFLNFSYLNQFKIKNFIYPYGVILFSLWGSSLIPEIKEILKGNKLKLKKVIFWSIFLSSLLYLLFSAIVLGVCQERTSQDGISCLINTGGQKIANFGFLFGIAAAFSSFLTLGITLEKTFLYDAKLGKFSSLAISCILPFLLYILGFRQFVDIIGFIGAFVLGIEVIITILIFKNYLKQKLHKKMPFFYYFLPLFVSFGVILEILHIS